MLRVTIAIAFALAIISCFAFVGILSAAVTLPLPPSIADVDDRQRNDER